MIPNNVVSIAFTRKHLDAVIPSRGTDGAAAFDLTSVDVRVENGVFIVNTGLRTAFSDNYVMLVFGRSGLARKHGLHLANGVGVIDSDYRGDIQLMFRCEGGLSEEEILELLAPGNRVAQAMFLPIPVAIWSEVFELPETVRGEGGFGSTGVK